jgi:ABC-type glutathione transport system ATPase component
MGKVRPDAGKSEWGYEARVGYFAQDHREQLGDSKQTIEAWLWDICPGEPIGFVRGQLAAVLFSGDEVKKKLSSLSGGEAARMIFCRHMVEKPNVLMLDEPTNHLDLEAIDALVKALVAYPGTLIFVSHDRWFVAQLATRVVEITRDHIEDFHGTYDEYLERCGDDHLDSEAVLRKAREEKRRQRAVKEQTPADQRELVKRRKQLDAELARVNQQIATTEGRINAINETFCDPTYFERSDAATVRKLEREQNELKGKLDTLLLDWERLERDLEALREAVVT